MNSKTALRNIIASLCYEIIAMIYGFVLPRLILCSFGSEVNGLVASLGQFLNYIALLEGGLSGVIKASLYKPLANRDYEKVSSIIKTAESFFRKIAVLFVLYSLAVAMIYPLAVKTTFSWSYVFSLTVIISLSLFVQYFFSLTYKLLITADRNGYIISISQILFTGVNFVLSLIVVYVYPEIHLLKLFNAIAYIIQPIVFSIYIKKHYTLNKDAKQDSNAIAQRWNGFGQNIAYFIHTNTDIVILTIFSSLKEVSVYSVYFMVANAIKMIVGSVSGAITPSLGNVLAVGSEKEKNDAFDMYEFSINQITIFAFICGALLVTPFVSIYTNGVEDANYFRPIFGYLIMIAEAIYCFREPYVNAAYASGKFKETASFAYIEAVINIAVSIILVRKYGASGVAVGTLVSMSYRYVAHVIYLKKNILNREITKWLSSVVNILVLSVISVLIWILLLNKPVSTYLEWFIIATITACVVLIILILYSIAFKHQLLTQLFRKIIRKK